MKTVLVTGGARGIGAAICRLLAARGYSVCVNYRNNSAAADATVEQILSAGGQACAIRADISDPGQCQVLYETCGERLGTVFALVNNAGIIAPESKFADLSVERLQRMIQVNVLGLMYMSQIAVRQMSTRRGGQGGVIVNISSIAASLGSPNEFVDYAASKGAVDTFTLGLGKEVADEGIRVIGVRPGLIDTDLHGDSGDRQRPFRLQQNVPMKRVGVAEEVANVVAFAISKDAGYMTATSIDVSGGR